MAKLMKPLFIDGMYNREGKRIRANYLKTVGEYPLWIRDGEPDKNYGKNEKDKYYVYIEHDDWLVMTGYTEYDIEQRAGQDKLNKEWYGGYEERQKYLDEHFYKGRPYTEAWNLIREHNKKEEVAITEYGQDESVQYEFLKAAIKQSINKYIDARDNNGKFADFIGALFLGELDQCEVIASKLREERQKREEERRRLAEQEKARKVEEERKEEQLRIENAEKVLTSGGIIKGGEVIVKLADKYNINMPIRTRGWALNNLAEVNVSDSGSISYRYWKSKNATGSQKIYDVLFDIRRAIMQKGA